MIKKKEKATFAYTVNFRVTGDDGVTAWPHYLIDATHKEVLHQWDNIQTLTSVNGPGGNQKTGKYQYGQTGIPALGTTATNNTCYLSNNKLRVINANNTWSILNPSNPTPVNHPCAQKYRRSQQRCLVTCQ